ncbi:MAG: cytochrome c-type biogenesis protein CcmH [Chloroflexota bacterium]|nr:cytochrome c-type biogenesis protein CcmH [Chloroflexota bacterium]
MRPGRITFAEKASLSQVWKADACDHFLICLCISLFFFVASIAQAQDVVISDNAVNAVAEKMYCPVCENIPLDECQTRACIEWKEEIRLQLAGGKDEAAVINDFVGRFGEQVVGIPQDPVLRGLTVLTPILAFLLAIALGAYTFSRFGGHRRLSISDEADLSATVADDVYRQRLEEDLAARR